jgi:hypothetical protein
LFVFAIHFFFFFGRLVEKIRPQKKKRTGESNNTHPPPDTSLFREVGSQGKKKEANNTFVLTALCLQ